MEKVDRNHKTLHCIPIFTVAEKEANEQWAYSPPLFRNVLKNFQIPHFGLLGKIAYPPESGKQILFPRENVCCNEGLEQLQWELLKMGCQMLFYNSEQCFGTPE